METIGQAKAANAKITTSMIPDKTRIKHNSMVTNGDCSENNNGADNALNMRHDMNLKKNV